MAEQLGPNSKVVVYDSNAKLVDKTPGGTGFQGATLSELVSAAGVAGTDVYLKDVALNGNTLDFSSVSGDPMASVDLSPLLSGAGGGLEGTDYVFVSANGTPEENANEFFTAYVDAALKIQSGTPITGPIISNGGAGTFNGWNEEVQQPVGGAVFSWLQQVFPDPNEIINTIQVLEYGDSAAGKWNRETVLITGFGSTPFDYISFIVLGGEPDYLPTDYPDIRFVITDHTVPTVLLGQGRYDFSQLGTVTLDKAVNIMTIDGQRSASWYGSQFEFAHEPDGDYEITISGIDFLEGGVKDVTSYVGYVFKNIKSVGSLFRGGRGLLYGTFIDCEGERESFGFDTYQINAEFYGCRAGSYSFGAAVGSDILGKYKDCVAVGEAVFGNNVGGNISADYIDCGELNSDGEGVSNIAFGAGVGGSVVGNYENCKSGIASFGFEIGANNKATYKNCIGTGEMCFGAYGSGHNFTLLNCIGYGPYSFGFRPAQGTSPNGLMKDCLAYGDYSFGWDNGVGSAMMYEGRIVGCYAFGTSAFNDGNGVAARVLNCVSETGTITTTYNAGVVKNFIDNNFNIVNI